MKPDYTCMWEKLVIPENILYGPPNTVPAPVSIQGINHDNSNKSLPLATENQLSNSSPHGPQSKPTTTPLTPRDPKPPPIHTLPAELHHQILHHLSTTTIISFALSSRPLLRTVASFRERHLRIMDPNDHSPYPAIYSLSSSSPSPCSSPSSSISTETPSIAPTQTPYKTTLLHRRLCFWSREEEVELRRRVGCADDGCVLCLECDKFRTQDEAVWSGRLEALDRLSRWNARKKAKLTGASEEGPTFGGILMGMIYYGWDRKYVWCVVERNVYLREWKRDPKYLGYVCPDCAVLEWKGRENRGGRGG